MKRFLPLILPVLLAGLAGCSSNRPAPVVDSRPQPPKAVTASPKAGEPSPGEPAKAIEGRTHVIAKGETLIAIALQYGLDYRELAAWNNIENPNVIKLGEVLRITAPEAISTTGGLPKPGEPVATPLTVSPMPTPAGTPLANTEKYKVDPKTAKVPYTDAAYAKLSAEAAAAGTAAAASASTAAAPAGAAASGDPDWAWPVKGKLLAMFTESSKGIDISGTRNTPVLAAAGGKVIYNQSGLRGYGRLVIIKHNDNWLSAYAHNEKVLVIEGQAVKKGEKIAEMGSSDSDVVKLHFEIRRQGKPVDPMKFLPAQ
ncbi:MAG: peptidoglycan DD-metalloendopeptidase family protein [Betaproteobacteria bacterium]|nr:peptidoglycan DD-metalloendopeptidase family protein [Betaproteobacteria bacterium]